MATYNGTNGDDIIVATAGSNQINAGEGNNRVTAVTTGSNQVNAGNGNDIITTGSGDDNINAGGGNNVIDAGAGNNTVNSGSGNDTITTGDGNDNIYAGDGRNIINAGGGNNNVNSGSGDDEIRTGAGNDNIYAGDGNNLILAGEGNNNVTAGSGDDTITTGSGNDNINAGDGRNVINAGGGNNNVNSGRGDDTITTGDGDDNINAGDGANWISAGNGRNNINTGNGSDTIFSGAGDDNINAGEGNNWIDAGGGNNNVNTGSGADTITTGDGNDNINAGEGANVINAGGGNNNINTGSGADRITAGSGNDNINAGEGNNIIDAGGGNNNVTAGSGNDQITSGSGNDQIYAGEGANVVNAGDGNNNVYSGSGADIITTGSGNDGIWAGEGNNVINAGNGNNSVYTGSGADTIVTGSGNDNVWSGEGNDVISLGGGNDTVYAGGGNDVIRHVVAENVGAHDDYWAEGGNDTLQLVLTAAEAQNAAIIADINRFKAYLASGQNWTFQFTAFDLTARQFENLEIVAPVKANADSATVTEDNSVAINVLANDVDFLAANTSALNVISYNAAGLPGTLTLNGNVFTYTPGAVYQNLAVGQSATVQFTYTMGDNQGYTDTATVTLTITGTNDAPVAVADVASITENQAVSINVLANDTDVDNGAVLTLLSATAPAGKGTVSVVNNQLAFNPGTAFDHLKAGATEVVMLTYVIKDEYGAQSTSTVTLTIAGTNDGPVAVADIAAGTENQTLTINVLANDTDVDDGAVFTLVSATAPAGKGTTSIVGNQLVFNPGTAFDHLKAGATEVVTLTYVMKDEFGAQSNSTVTVTITGTNDAPIAVADTAAGTENQTLTINVLANDTDVDDGAVFTLTSASAPAGKGTTSIVGNQLVFNPGTAFDHLAAGVTEVVTLTYAMKDDQGATSTSTVSVTVTGTNDAPVAQAASTTATEDGAIVTGTLISTDVDDGATASFALNAPVAGLTLGTNGAYSFNPGNAAYQALAAGEVLVVTAPYTVTDDKGATSTAVLTITVTGTNDAPIAIAAAAAQTEDAAAITGQLTSTDVDHGATASYALNAPVTGLTLNANGSYSFVATAPVYQALAAGETLVVTAPYTVTDDKGATSTSTLTITVTGTNDAPVAIADTAAGTENQTLTIDVLANDTDVDNGHAFTLLSATAPAGKGVASVVGNQLVFTPGAAFDHLAAGAIEIVTLSYAMKDDQGAESVSTVTVTITGTNDGPVAVADAATIDNDKVLTLDVLANDSDIDDGHVLTLTTVSTPAGKGSVAIVNNQLVFTAGDDFDYLGFGVPEVVTLTYSVTDEHGAVATSTVTVTVLGTNTAPDISGPVTGAAIEDAAGVTLDALANASDVDADPLTVVNVPAALPAGVVYDAVTHSFTLDPANAAYQALAAGETVTVSVAYGVSDGIAISAASVSWTVTGTNDGPVAVADVAAGTENQTLVIDVLANDTDVDNGHVFTLVSTSAPAGKGTAAIVGNQLVFHPGTAFDHLAAGATETVVLTYGMTDEHGAASTSTVTVTITGTNDAPVAVADVAAGTENQTLTIDVLANDGDVDDGHVFTLVSATAPAGKGTASIVGNQLVFNPGAAFDHLAAGATEVVVLSYAMKDDQGADSVSTVTVTITGTNDAPIAQAASFATVEDAAMVTGSVVATDIDDGATLSFALNAPVAGLTLGANGAYSFDPGDAAYQALAQGEVLVISAPYTVTDNLGATSTATLTITLTGTNDAPVAVADVAAATEDAAIVTGSVATNDHDVDHGATASYALDAPVAGLTLNADGSYSFDPSNAAYQALAAGETTVVVASYTVTDDHGATATSTLTITVTGTNDTPVAVADSATVAEDLSITVDVLANDTDVDNGHAFTLLGATAPSGKGSVLVSGNQLVYVPGANFNHLAQGASEIVTLSYTMRDEQGAQSTATVSVTVTGTNDAPTISSGAAAATGSVTEAGSYATAPVVPGTPIASGLLTAADADDGAVLTFTGSANGTYGSFAIAANGAWTYTLDNARGVTQALAAGQSATESFTTTVTDEYGATATQTVTVTVHGTNDGPVVTSNAADAAGAVIEAGNLDDGTVVPGVVTASGQLVSSDVDSGATATWSGSGTGAYGSFAIGANGAWTYTLDNSRPATRALAEGQTVTDTFLTTVTDDQGAIARQLVTVTISGTNDSPVVGTAPATGTVVEAGNLDAGGVVIGVATATGQLASTDVDNGATATWSGNADGTYGSFAIAANGVWTYTLDNARAVTGALAEGQSVTESFTATVTDDKGATATKIVTVTVVGTNDSPVITSSAAASHGDLIEAGVDTAGVATATGQLSSADIDAGATATWSGSATGAYGSLSVNANGLWTYTLDNARAATQALAAGQTGTESFTVRVTDDKGAIAEQVVTMTVTGTNDAPVVGAAAQSGTVIEAGNTDPGAVVAGTPTATGTLTSTDVDSGATATWNGSANGTYGALTINANGQWSYALDNSRGVTQALAEGQSATETFTATVTDDHGATATKTISVTVIGANDSPVITSSAAQSSGALVEAGVDVAGVATASGQLSSTDVDSGATATWSIPGSATGTYGSLQLNAAGAWTYALDNARAATQALAEGQTATESFTVRVTDDKGAIADQTVTLTISGTNDAPVVGAAAQGGAVVEAGNLANGTVVTGTPTATGNLTSTDVDSGATATWSGSANGTYGALTVAANGQWSYALDNSRGVTQALTAGQIVTESFTTTVTDDKGATATKVVTVTVTGTNDSPVITSTAAASHGAVVEAGFGVAGVATAAGQLSSTDVDAGATATWSLPGGSGTYGTLAISASGAWTYTLDDNRAATQALAQGQTVNDVITVAVTDDKGAVAYQSVTVTVTGTNDAPVVGAAAQTGTVVEAAIPYYGANAPGTPTASGTLTATDDSGSVLSWSGSANGTYGTFTVGTNGQWTYALDNSRAVTEALPGGASVTETFLTTVTDQYGVTATKSVTITVQGTNDAPVATHSYGDVTEAGVSGAGTPVAGNPTASGQLTSTDVDAGATASWSLVGASTYGSVALAADGSWTYTLDNSRAATQALAEGQTATDYVLTRVTDDKGGFTYVYIIVSVHGTNDAPVVGAAAQSGTVIEAGYLDNGTVVAGTPTATGQLSATDVDTGATATWSGNANGTYGTFAVAANGVWTYTLDNSRSVTQALAEGQSASETFTTTVTDDKGAIATKTVTVTVVGTNDVPVITSTAAQSSGAVSEAGVDVDHNIVAGNPSASGQLSSTDVDAGATATWSVPGGTGTYGTLSISASGAWSYTLDNARAATQALAQGQTATDSILVAVTDDKGAVAYQAVSITVTGANDGPVVGAAAATGTVVEAGNLTNGTIVAGTPTATGTVTATDVDSGSVLTWSGNANGTYGSFAIAANGQWTYTLDNSRSVTQALTEGQTAIESFTTTVTDQYGVTATKTVTVTVNGTNDSPVTTNFFAGTVVEAGVGPGNTPVAGSVNLAGQLTSTDVDANATATWSLASNGSYGSATVNADGTWTYTLDNSRQATQQLAKGQNGTDYILARVTDDRGAYAYAYLIVTVTGTNDAPIVSVAAQTGTVVEAGNADNGTPMLNTPQVSGTLTATDIDSGSVLSWSGSATGAYGSLSVAANGVWTYTIDNNSAATQALSEGQSVTETFVATVTDQFGATDTKTVTVTVLGSNDTPVIVAAGTSASGAVTELADHAAGENSDILSTSGVIAFSDVDAIQSHSATVAPQGAGYLGTLTLGTVDQAADTVGWTFSVSDGALDYLAAGQTVTQNYTVTIKDDRDGIVTKTVTITLTGTNDAPIITGAGSAAGGVTEANSSGTLSTSNSFVFQDVDLTDAHSVTVAAPSFSTSAGVPAGAFTAPVGSLVASVSENTADQSNLGSVVWTYSVNDSLVQKLAAGETLTQVYTVSVRDASGTVATQDVTITITGTNDSPTLFAATDVNAAIAEGSTTNTLSDSGSFIFDDVDLSNAHSVSVGAAVVNRSATVPSAAVPAGGFGTLVATVSEDTTDLSGHGTVNWTFTVNDAAIQGLAVGETVTQLYPVTLIDSAGTGFVQFVTVVITGAEDAPTIVVANTTATGAITEIADGATGENTATLNTHGAVAFADVDMSDTHSASFTAQAGGYLGTFTIGAVNPATKTISWNFDIADSAIDYLAKGQVLTQVYNVKVDDGHGGTVIQPVTVTITGTDDAPTLNALATPAQLLLVSDSNTLAPLGDGLTNYIGQTFKATGSTLSSINLPISWTGGSGSLDFHVIIATVTTDGSGNVHPGQVLFESSTISLASGSSNVAVDLGNLSVVSGQQYVVLVDSKVTSATAGGVGSWATGVLPGVFYNQYYAYNDGQAIYLDAASGSSRADDFAGSWTASASKDLAFTLNYGNNSAISGAVLKTGAGSNALAGSFGFSDVDTIDTHSTLITPGAAGYVGTLVTSVDQQTNVVSWNFNVDDADLGFINSGERRTQIYDIAVDDGQGGVVHQKVTIQLGSNNAVVADAAKTVATGAITELANTANSFTARTATGTVGFTDVDTTDVHTATLKTVNPGYIGTLTLGTVNETTGKIDWTFSVPDRLLDYLDAGQSVVQNYVVTVSDGHGGSYDQTITITLNGAADTGTINHAPVITSTVADATGSVIEAGTVQADGSSYAGVPTATGLLTATDADSPAMTWSGTQAGTYGSFIIDNFGRWTYVLNNAAPATQALTAGQTASETFTAVVTDVVGNKATQTVTVNVTGSYDDDSLVIARAPATVATAQAYQLVTNGSATALSNNMITLTGNADNQTGSAFLSQAVDMRSNFSITYAAKFGANDLGGDGIAFLIQANPAGANALGNSGTGLGALGLANGIAVMMDTITPNSTAGDDGVRLINTATGAILNTSAPGSSAYTLQLENGGYHTVTISWNAATRTLTYNVDGINKDYIGDIVNTMLGGSTTAYLGFSGTTGSTNNVQQVIVGNLSAVLADHSQNPVYTENGAAVTLVGLAIDADFTGQSYTSLHIKAAGVADGANEVLTIGGIDIKLGGTAGTSGSFTFNGKNYFATLVQYGNGDRDVVITQNGQAIDERALEQIVGGITYRDNGENPTQGDRTFTFQMEDAAGAHSAAATATVTVVPVNDAPSRPAGFNIPITEDAAPSTIDGLATFTDPEGKPLSIVITGTLPTGVTYDAATHSFTFDPHHANYQHLGAGQSAPVTLSYSVTDGQTTTQVITLWTITGTDDAPVVSAPQTLTAIEGQTALTIDAIANATAPVSAPPRVWGFPPNLPVGVTYDLATDSFTFDPTGDYYRGASNLLVSANFTYTNENVFIPATAAWTVSQTASGIVAAPVINPAIYALHHGETSVGSVTYTSLPAGVTYVGGTFRIDLGNAAYQGLAVGQTQTVNVTFHAGAHDYTTGWTITGSDHGPIVSNTLVGGDVAGVVADGSTLSVVNLPTTYPAGVTYNSATHSFSLDPTNAAYASLAVGQKLVVSTAYGLSNGIIIKAQVAQWTVIGTANGPVAIAMVNASANATDIDDNAAFTLSNVPATLPAGVLYDAANKSFGIDARDAAYNHLAAGQTQVVTVDYNLVSNGVSVPTSISWTVTGTNDAPVAVADTATTTENAPLTIDALANDSDVDDGAVLSITAASVPAGKGSVAIVANKLAFDPGTAFDHLAAGATETVVISYTVTDDKGAAVTSTATVTITGTNDAPVVSAPLSAAVSEDGAVSTFNALSGASDVDDGAVLSVTGVGTLPAGVTYNAATKIFSFNPADAAYQAMAAGETQTVSVAYSISDGTASVAQTVSWTISGTNDAPVVTSNAAAASGAVVEAGSSVAGTAVATGTLTSSDVDHGATAAWSGSADGTYGHFAINAAGAWTYTLDNGLPATAALEQGQIVTETFTATVTDDKGATATQIVTVQVTGSEDNNHAPVSADGVLAATEDGAPVTGHLVGSDVDADETVLTYAILSHPAEGAVTLHADGSYSFDPGTAFQDLAAGATRDVSFTYDVTDTHGVHSAVGTVVVTVTGTNDAPVVTPSVVAPLLQTDAPSTVDALAHASDADTGAVLDVVFAPEYLPAGVTYDAATHGFTLFPDAYAWLGEGQPQTVVMHYGVTDGTTTTDTSISWTVTGINDAPIVTGNFSVASSVLDGPVYLEAFSNVVDVDHGTGLAVVGIDHLPAGVLFFDSIQKFMLYAGNLAYQDLLPGETQTVTVSYGISDGETTTPATIEWVITGTFGEVGDTITGTANGDALYGTNGPDVIIGGPGENLMFGGTGNDVFVFHAGEADGDSVADFDGNGAFLGDSLRFEGYGQGTFTQVDATHWQVTSEDGTLHETITFQNAPEIHASDYTFI